MLLIKSNSIIAHLKCCEQKKRQLMEMWDGEKNEYIGRMKGFTDWEKAVGQGGQGERSY